MLVSPLTCTEHSIPVILGLTGRRQVEQWLVSRSEKPIPQEQGAGSVPGGQRGAGFSDGCPVRLWSWDLRPFLVWSGAACDCRRDTGIPCSSSGGEGPAVALSLLAVRVAPPELLADDLWAVVPPLQPFLSARMRTGPLQAPPLPCAKCSQSGVSALCLKPGKGLGGSGVGYLVREITCCLPLVSLL